MEESSSLAEPLASPPLPAHPSSPNTFATEHAERDLPVIGSGVNTVKLATLGPWYHTLGIVLLLLLYAFIAHLTHHSAAGGTFSRVQQTVSDAARVFAETPKLSLYGSTIMLSWLLLSAVVAGLYHRRAFFRTTLYRRFTSRWVDFGLGVAIYVSFLATISLLVLLFTAALMVGANHAHNTAGIGSTQTQSTNATTSSNSSPTATAPDTTPAQRAQAVQDRVQRILHVNHDAVASLAPHTVPALLLWIVLSATAGFCEEHIFRGYLLSQALAAMRRLAMPPWLAATLSVLATSVLFGSLHLYEGVGGAVIVGLLGAVLAIMTLVLGNLRAVIVAHFLQDFLGGLVYYIAHLRHAA